MNTKRMLDITPSVPAPLDPDFRPASIVNREFRALVRQAGGTPIGLALERSDGSRSLYSAEALRHGHPDFARNLPHFERIVKFLLWQRGGYKLIVGGPREIGEHIRHAYSPTGSRAFDFDFMGGVYERPFEVIVCEFGDLPPANEMSQALGRHLDGCRIGFDAGASDRKVSAVVDGRPVFSEEVVWDPKPQADPEYHYREINEAIRSAAAHLPRVDAIGVSAAGIYINNRAMVASLFRGVPKALFDTKIKDLFIRIGREWGAPLAAVNDGEVTALAGSMGLGVNAILGIAMGSSEAAGYVTRNGNITTWLNELAFAPVDYSPAAPVDEWSGDRGVGALYFSQQAVFRLAPVAGIHLDPNAGAAEQLKQFQGAHKSGDPRTRLVYETIGAYLGYGIAHYAEFYDLEHVLILGRVTSGEGGVIVLDKAREALENDFPEHASHITLHLPDENSRRIGQSIAAASLPSR